MICYILPIKSNKLKQQTFQNRIKNEKKRVKTQIKRHKLVKNKRKNENCEE